MFKSASVALALLLSSLSSEIAFAEWNPSGPGEVVGGGCFPLPGSPNGVLVYQRNGDAWTVGPSQPWQRTPELDLPVPVDQIKCLDTDNAGTLSVNIMLVTVEDIAWGFVGLVGSGEWHSLGALPVGPVSKDRKSWGGIKSAYQQNAKDK